MRWFFSACVEVPSERLDELIKLGVKRVVNCTKHVPCYHENAGGLPIALLDPTLIHLLLLGAF